MTGFARQDLVDGLDEAADMRMEIPPDIDRGRVQRVADEMYQFRMLGQPFHVSSMLGGL